MLFIYGDVDIFVFFEMLDEVYNVVKVEKEKLIVLGVGYGEVEKVDLNKYWNIVWKFVGKYILV